MAEVLADAGHDPAPFHANHLPAGTSRDYEYTDWDEVESFADALD